MNVTPPKTILLVEKDPVTGEADAETIQSFGFTVRLAGCAEKAFGCAISNPRVDLLLIEIDRDYPLDGVQMARDILCRLDVPIVFFTACLDERILAMIAGIACCYGVIIKSSGKFAWQATIQMALERFEERQKLQNSEEGDRNILERQQAEQALHESEERLHQILSSLHEAIWLRDINTRQVLYVNPAFEQLTGLRREDFYQDPNAFIDIIHPEDKPWVIKNNKYRSDIHRIIRPDGTIRWVWGRTFPVMNEAGEVYRTAVIAEDITDRKQTEEKLKLANEKLMEQMREIQLLQSNLRDQVIRDPLTGLYNRRYLSETLDRELDRARREGYPVSLVMIDIDHFKQVNDTYGHFAGDVVLKHLAHHLAHHTRASDLVCRLGGDEFLLVLPNLPAQGAFERAEQCRRDFETSFAQVDQIEIRATLSIGIAMFPDHGANSLETLTAADRAMYEAKVKGRNQVICC